MSNNPDRIWATVNGASTRLPDGARQLIGGWSEDKDRPRAVEYVRADLFRRQSPAGVEPVGYVRSETLAKLHDGDAGPIVGVAAFDTTIPLYASPTKAVTVTGEMRQAIRVLKLIADGYSAKGDGLGEFVQVENPDYRPDNGSDPYIVVDIAALSSEAHNGREVE